MLKLLLHMWVRAAQPAHTSQPYCLLRTKMQRWWAVGGSPFQAAATAVAAAAPYEHHRSVGHPQHLDGWPAAVAVPRLGVALVREVGHRDVGVVAVCTYNASQMEGCSG